MSVNILLEGFEIDAPWLYGELKNYIKPNHSVAVIAFSFRENRVRSLVDWEALYGKEICCPENPGSGYYLFPRRTAG